MLKLILFCIYKETKKLVYHRFILKRILEISTLAFDCSERGCRKALYNSSEYWDEGDLKSGTKLWRCCQHKKRSCRVRIVTYGDRVLGEGKIEHTHGSSMAKCLASKVVAAMKTKMESVEST